MKSQGLREAKKRRRIRSKMTYRGISNKKGRRTDHRNCCTPFESIIASWNGSIFGKEIPPTNDGQPLSACFRKLGVSLVVEPPTKHLESSIQKWI